MSVLSINTVSTNLWFSNLVTTANRIFHTIGYSRAAAELTKLGYYEEADRCKKLLLKLKKSKES